MTLTSLILITVKLSIVLSVFAIGLSASIDDATYLFRNPAKLGRVLLSMYVILPVFAVALSLIFDLHPAVEIALVALSISPVPPILPRKAFKAGSDEPYVIGVLTTTALLTVIVAPLSIEAHTLFGIPMSMSPLALAKLALISILLPLGIGILVRRFKPKLADMLAKPIAIIALILLLAVLPIVVAEWPAIKSLIGNGTLIAFIVFIIVGLTAGHLLGGPETERRPMLAFATSSRHPAIALTIAHINFPDQKLVTAAVLLYMLVNMVVSIPYMVWIKRKHTIVDQGVLTAQQ